MMGSSIPIYPIYEGETFYPLATRRNDWRDSLLAALPHLWVGIGFTLVRYDFGNSAGWLSKLGIYSRVAFLIVCLGLMAYAWYRGWPLWSASWYFYAAWFSIIVFLSFVNRISPHAWVLNAILILGGLGAMALTYLFIFRAARLHALLAGLFLMPVATQFELEAIPNDLEAVIAILFAVLASAAAIGIVRIQSWAAGVVFALLANMMAGVTLTYICFYRAEIPGFYGSAVDGNSFLEAVLSFAFYFALAVALFIGPLVFWYLVERFRRYRRRSQGGVH